jgi:hypothetical protein
VRRRSRETQIFSLSFLDAITAGFGAVILLFMIINASVDTRVDNALEDVTSEVARWELRVEAGRKNLVEIKQALAQIVEQWASLQAVRQQLSTEIRTTQDDLIAATTDSAARQAAVERLKAELAALESESQRLQASSITPEEAGDRIRSFAGEGDRLYLAGIRMRGERVAIFVDVSTSMLDRTLVNILRRRNMAEADKQRAPKWRQAVRTVDWMTTQIDPGAQFQIYAYNSRAWSLIEGTDGQWLPVGDGANLEKAVQSLRGMSPEGPTSLAAAFTAARQLQPRPDQIYLITDGLPTMGEIEPNRPGVTGKERWDHFNRAARDLPGPPISVILLALEGDPRAAPAYWWLTLRTGGQLLAPADDWP